ncbi:MAG: aminotransferase class V-fold PLP-dependent enzyme [Clostridium sp.]|uniref:aminotransferase class V-fold PLP-dependent enzyme n=1 Tax=Clostridium sp. TaxID=1506 RepID=UPI003D6D901B
MKQIYLDNAATAFPKAPGVAESICDYITNIGCNVNRGAYSSSYSAEKIVFETRELICKLFSFDKPENVIFNKNITESLNTIIKGLFKTGDHVIVSSMEHNAVMRPLNSILKNGVEFSRVQCNNLGELDVLDIAESIKPTTKAIIMTAASNVCGTVLPLYKVGQICKKHNLYFIIDSAQGAGFMDLNFNLLCADIIAFTGHKGLLGPQGVGGFITTDKLATLIEPLIEGGTGSLSEEEIQPIYMPDKFEAGTPNIPGIFGLNASLKYLLDTGIDTIREKELYLTELFIKELKNIPKVKLIGIPTIKERTAVVSLDLTHSDLDNGIMSHHLSKDYGIMTRCGLHCAPSAHKTLGTFPSGTVRFSFSHSNSKEDVLYTINSINKCMKIF